MAGYDGEIRINTKIETEDARQKLIGLQIQMNKTAQKIESISKKMDDLKNAKVEDTAKWKSLQNNIDIVRAKLESLEAKARDMEGPSVPTKKYKQLEKTIEDAEGKLQGLLNMQEEFVSLGFDRNSGGYQNVQKQIDATKSKIEALNLEKEKEKLLFGNQTGTDAYKAVKADLQSACEEMRRLKAEEKNLETAFNSDKTAGINKLNVDLQNANGEMNVIKSKMQQVLDKERQINSEGNKFSGIIKKSQTNIKKVTSTIGKAVGKMKNLTAGTTQANHGFSNIARTIKSMILSMAVFQIMSKGIEFLKAGLQNLAVYSKDYNKSMSDLISSTAQLKNALAVAFQPVLNVVIPILVKLVNWVSAAANAISRFLAILGGKSTYTKAIAQNKDYAESLDKVGSAADDAKGSLASYDELNVMQKNNSGSSGSSGGADGSGFVEEAVGEISDWAQNFKDAIEAGDWYGVGALVAEKLNEALASIEWNRIHEKAREIGQGIALAINGFVANADWTLVGGTVGNGLNTAIYFAQSFIGTLDFGSIGTAIYQAINGFIATVDWAALGNTIGEGLKGIVTVICTALEGVDWQAVADAVYEFLKNVDWSGIVSGICEGVGALLGGIIEFLIEFIANLGDDLYEEYFASGEKGATGFLLGLAYMFMDINQWLYDNMIFPLVDGVMKALGLDSSDTVFGDLGELTIEGYYEGMAEKLGQISGWIKRHMIDPLIGSLEGGLGLQVSSKGSSKVFKSIGQLLMQGFEIGVQSMFGGVLGVFENLQDRIVKIFTKLKTKLFAAINSIIGGVESMANGVISAINGMINALNRLSFTAPDWVPDIGGKNFNLNLSTIGTISIPRLANGGVTTGSTLANIGEAGKEAVIPLERNTEWMDTFAEVLAGKMGGTGAQTIDLAVNLDGNQVYRRMVQLDHEFAGRTGHSQFAY